MENTVYIDKYDANGGGGDAFVIYINTDGDYERAAILGERASTPAELDNFSDD